MSNDSSPTSQQQRIERLECRLRRIQVFTAAATLSLIAVLCVAVIGRVYASAPDQTSKHARRNASFDTITVKRINVVDNDRTRRLVISDKSHMPNGKGHNKRLISPAGVIFYDEKGHERGGIGLAPRYGGEQSALVFDYNCGEAIALAKQQHGKHTNAELIAMDPGGTGCADGPERIKVQTVDGKAQIVLNDAKGRSRLRFIVPKSGKPAIEFLNAKGAVTHKVSPYGVSTGS
jgi:hypothetical protein